jgi:predicted permease
MSDLRYAVRQLIRQRGFSLVVVVTLALGIGANTAVFGLVNALLLRPLPGIADQDRLVRIGRTQDGDGFDTFAYPDLLDFRAEAGDVIDIAAHRTVATHLSTGSRSDRIIASIVSGTYFPVLGARPALGRLFNASDDATRGAHPLAVLSHDLWTSRFGGDSTVVGSTASLNGFPYTIVGVTAAGFTGAEFGSRPDLYVPLAMTDQMMVGRAPIDLLEDRGAVWLEAVGRLTPGVTPDAARGRMQGIARRLEEQYPGSNEGRGVTLIEGVAMSPGTRDDLRRGSLLLLAIVGAVLLIACANVASLVLARGVARTREIAVRASLGAGRRRLVRLTLVECLVLAAFGAVGGLWLALWLNGPLRNLPIVTFGTVPEIGLDWRVLGFLTLVTVLATVLFAVPPAIRAARTDLVSGLKDGASSGRGASRFRAVLVVAQMAVSLALLVAAGLLIRTLDNAYRVAPGMDLDRVLVASMNLSRQGYGEAEGRAFYQQLVERARGLAGVEQASLALSVPLDFSGWDTRLYRGVEPPAPDEPGFRTDRNAVTSGYFGTMGIPLLRGRDFDASDANGPAVAIVNQAAAELLDAGPDPIGVRFRLSGYDTPIEVIGLARDAKYRTVLEPRRPMVYLPYAGEEYWSQMTLHVRSATPLALAAPLRDVARELDPDLPLYGVGTLAGRRDQSLGTERAMATLLAVFALLALALCAVGLYGALSYAVGRRTRELGIRVAVGAGTGEIRRMVLRQGLVLAGIGATIGVAAAFATSGLLQGYLFEVSPTDPLTYGGVAALLLLVAVAACWMPARRATRISPMEALRHE